MAERFTLNGDSAAPKTEANDAYPSIPIVARKILMESLIDNKSLNMPASVTEFAHTVNFTPEVDTFLPTSMKMSESASAMWGCIGLFADAICRKRYQTSEPKKIVVDVYSATLMLCSVFLFEVNGKHFMESQVAPRAMYLDKGHMRETYRITMSNM